MADIVDPALEAYAEAHTTAPEDHLLALAEETRTTLSAPQMMVGALEGRFLEMLVYALRPSWVLEIGTFSGYSSLSMAAGLPPGGRITTCELSPVHAAVARSHIARSAYAELIEVIEGPALDTVGKLEGPFDFVFIDADKTNNAAYLEWALRLSRPGTAIVVDNVVREGEVVDASSRSTDVVGVRRMFELMAREKRLSATAIQTVGAKGWDGFALAIVT